MIDPNELIEFNGVTMPIHEIPDAVVRTLMGIGHFCHPSRGVAPVQRAFEFTPNTCLNTDSITEGNEWVVGTDGEEYLICTYCGLDGT